MKCVISFLFLLCLAICYSHGVYGESYYMSCILGNSLGDGGLATDASIYPTSTYVAPNGEIYIAQADFHTIRKVSLNGTITRFAGNGKSGHTGDGGLALNAAIGNPWGMVIDSNGNFYFADNINHLIRKINTNGIISAVAGTGLSGYSGDNFLAKNAALSNPSSLTIDSSGNLYISDTNNRAIRKIYANGNIVTWAGGQAPGNTDGNYGDGLYPTAAQVPAPYGLAIGPSGALYIADTTYSTIRKVFDNTITRVAGTTGFGYNGYTGTATSLSMRAPYGVAVDPSENIYISDTFNSIIRVVYPNGTMNTIAGTPVLEGFIGDNGLATSAVIHYPRSLDYHSGKIIFSDYKNSRVRSVDLTTGKITTVAGNGFGTTKSAALVPSPIDMAYTSDGSLVFCDAYSVRKLSADGTITRLAGLIGLNGNSNDGLILNGPRGVAIDSNDQIYFSDSDNHLIRKISTNGVVSIIAGTGTSGYSGDGGPATAAKLKNPSGLAFDSSGRLYIADSNNVIRRIDTNGVITTFAGTGTSGYSGDGGQATAAKLSSVNSIAFDSAGNMYFTDSGNYVIRKITTGGVISTIAGTGSFGSTGDGGLATQATFFILSGLAIDSTGQIFVSDSWSQTVRMISTSGIITTVAGNGWFGYSGEDVLATQSSLYSPRGLAINKAGEILIADMLNHRIRVLTLGHSCFGKSGASVCGGKGLCSALDTCTCNSGWSGTECSAFVCNGLNNCNGHGTCISNNTCTCNSGWKGNSQCSSFSCDGLNSCNGHGTCSSNNTCTCTTGWKGNSQCSSFSCDGLNSCNGHGTCSSNNTCTCTSGWKGSMDCLTFSCDGLNNCSGNGICSSNNTCQCTSGWTGINCSTPVTVNNPCTGVVCLNNGYCNNGICNCTNSWTGSNCSIPVTNSNDPCYGISCLNGGSCISGACNCTSGWTGSNCSVPVTNNNPCSGIVCVHGSCISNGICNCTSGWTGSNCSTPISNNSNNVTDACSGVVCLNNGTCISGICNCTSGWTGSNCSISVTNNVNNPCTGVVCLNNGTCNSGICNCTSGWKGTNCSIPSIVVTDPCSGISCLNGGSCLSGICNCTSAWTGSNCSIPVTNNINPCSNVVCLHGTCVSGICNCTQGWIGARCNISSNLYPSANLMIPQVVSQCDSLMLDSSQSTPLDGSLSYSWTGIDGPSLSKFNSLLASVNSSIVNIDTSTLLAGSYSVQVKITNWLGTSSKVSNFTISSNGVPTISFSSNSINFKIGTAIAIAPRIVLPTCYTGNGSISYSYAYTSPNLVKSSEIPLSSNMIAIGGTYGLQTPIPGIYSIWLIARADGADTASNSFTINAEAQPLEVSFSVPSLAQSQYTNISYTIRTNDPSNTNEVSSLKTVCIAESGIDCPSPGVDITKFSASYSPGTYKFVTTFTKGLRKASDFVTVTVLSLPASSIIRVSINTNGVNKDQVPSTSDFVIGYSTLDKLSSDATFSWSNSFGVKSTSSILTIPSWKLYPGTFNVSLSVTDGKKSGFADLQFTVAAPPVAGTCFSQPSSGKPLQTNFAFSCTGWTSTVSDITYTFYIFSTEQSSWYYLGSGRSFKSMVGSTALTGARLVKVDGSDSTGATTTFYFNVQVTSAPDMNAIASFFKQVNSDSNALSNNIASLAISSLSSIYNPSPTEVAMFKLYIDQVVTKLKATITNIKSLTGDFTDELSKEVLGVVSSISTILPKGLVTDSTISNILHTLSDSLIDVLLKSYMQLSPNDLNVLSNAIKKVVIYVQTQMKTSKRAFSDNDLTLLNGIIGNIATISTKNTMPDSPATVLDVNGITTSTRKVNVALLDSLVQNSSSTGSVKFSSSFSSLPEIIDTPVVTYSIQERASSSITNAATSIIQLSISSDGVIPLNISSNSAIATLKFAFKATRSIEAYNTICNIVSSTGSIAVAKGCSVVIGTDGTASASITETGSYVLTSTLINTPTILPTQSNSTNTNTNANDLSTILIAVLITSFSAILLVVLVVTICVLLFILRGKKKRKNAVGNDIELS